MIVALDLGKKVFIIHISFLGLGSKISIDLAWKAQIALLVVEKVTILAKYLNFANVFLEKLAIELLKYLVINKHSINLKSNKQSLYSLIYNLEPV